MDPGGAAFVGGITARCGSIGWIRMAMLAEVWSLRRRSESSAKRTAQPALTCFQAGWMLATSRRQDISEERAR